MPYLVTYKDFQGRTLARSYATSEANARGRVRIRAEFAELIKVEPISEAEHAKRQADLIQTDSRIYNRS